MAKILAQNFSIDLSQVVKNAITAVKATRRKEQARREAEFQRAIADGLSYGEQLKLREKWLKEEKESSFPDDEYIAVLEKSVSDTKKLKRFQTYREKYVATLNELNSGRINEEKYLEELEKQLDGVNDPELRLEILGDIATASKQVKSYKDTILQNQVVFAQKDGTLKVLDDAVDRVKTARASAAISENEDEITAYDEALVALNSQRNAVKIENEITGFQAKSATLGASPIEKLNFFNNQIENADANSPFRVGDKNYESARQYWEQSRNQYLAGESEIMGGNFFQEVQDFTDGQVTGSNARFGYTTQQSLFDVLNQYNKLAGRPEMQPFLVELDNAKDHSMNGVVLPSPTSVPSPESSTGATTPASSRVVPSTTAAPGAAPTPTPTPAPSETPASTPQPGTPPAAPAPTRQDAEGAPPITPAGGVGSVSNDGQFVFTQTGWKPRTVDERSPQYTPASGLGTVEGEYIYTENGWQLRTATTQVSSVKIPEATPVPIPAATPIKLPEVAPVTIPQGAPIAQETPPNYSPAGGFGTRVGNFIFTKKGWEPILKKPNLTPPNLNLANPLEAFSRVFPGKVETPAPAPASTPAPVSTPAPAPVNEYVVVAGDTLGAIAKKAKKTVKQIAEENQIQDPNKIKVGQKLKL